MSAPAAYVNNMNRLRVILLLFLILPALLMAESSQSSDSDNVITGTVTDNAGVPLQAVIIRPYFDGRPGKHVLTDKKGYFRITIDTITDKPISLDFSKIGYEKESVRIVPPYKALDITLYKAATILKEVTVAAPEIRLRGDTVSYLLSAFAGAGDVTLKDALKKIPGIEVDKSGKISYNGKDISNFYIEGMDLNGGKYDVATTNLPSSYVNAVEVISNHHDLKIDRGTFSDNVALNIRLKKQAMFRPTGTYTIGGGIGKPMGWEASGAAMMFRSDFQSMLSLKGTDIEEFSERSNNRFYQTGPTLLNDLATSAMPRLTASSAPLNRQRWIEPIDAGASLNFINKLKDEITLRTNIDYSYRQSEYELSDSRQYFDGAGDIDITQSSNPHAVLHTASVSNEYKINSDARYLINEFKGGTSFLTNHLPVTTVNSTISQYQKMTNFQLHDNFNWSWQHGPWRYSILGILELNASPKVALNISENYTADELESDKSPIFISQNGRSTSFAGLVEFSPMTIIGNSRLYMPINLSYTNERLNTSLYSEVISQMNNSQNKLYGETLNLKATPTYHLATPYERLTLYVTIPLELKRIAYRNNATSSHSTPEARFLTSPNMIIKYTLSSKSTFTFYSSYSRKIGNLLDYMISPVITDYMSATYGSGILSKDNQFNANLRYDFRLPMSMWFVNINANYSRSNSNLEADQNVSEGLIVTAKVLKPNSSETTSLYGAITKNIRNIKTKISLGGNYRHSVGSITQNDMPVKTKGDISTCNLTVSSSPLNWLEISYQGDFSNTTTKYLDRSRSFKTFNHDGSLAFYPSGNWQVKFSTEITDREIEPKRYKMSNLFDVSATYRYKKFRFDLTFKNILDCRSYSYTIFSGLDRFSYDYALRGRQLIAKVSFTL